jgi:hypothetical protein
MDTNEALDYFLEVRTGDLRSDVLAALRESSRRQYEGPRATQVILRVAKDQLGMSLRAISTASFDEHTGNQMLKDAISKKLAKVYE